MERGYRRAIKPAVYFGALVLAVTSGPLGAQTLNESAAAPDRGKETRLAQADSGEALFSQAFSFFRGGNYRAAAKEFQFGLESDGNNLAANYYLAESLRHLGQNEQAAEYYQRVTQIGPNSAEAMLARSALSEMRGEGGVNRRYQTCVAGVEQWHRECMRKFDVSVVGGGYEKACGKYHKRLMAKCRDKYQ